MTFKMKATDENEDDKNNKHDNKENITMTITTKQLKYE